MFQILAAVLHLGNIQFVDTIISSEHEQDQEGCGIPVSDFFIIICVKTRALSRVKKKILFYIYAILMNCSITTLTLYNVVEEFRTFWTVSKLYGRL